MTKKIVESKTKIGSVIGGGALVVGALWGMYSGEIPAEQGLTLLGVGIGAVLVGLGLRDALPN